MIYEINETHDPSAKSWVESANTPETDFPLQNLPFGVFRPRGGRSSAPTRIGVAIGDKVLDLYACAQQSGMFREFSPFMIRALEAPSLNKLMALGPRAWTLIRKQIFAFLRDKTRADAVAENLTLAAADVDLIMPVEIGDYSDFYASIHHATNVGSMFRPDNPLLPNYKYVPIGYHGRASSVVVSDTPVRRPQGQTREGDASEPTFGPSQKLDYEMEVGCFIGAGNERGAQVKIEDAGEQIFGLCLVNDWSARDIQSWEYQPLGPFLAKSFATSISPWIVTAEALAPFRVAAYWRAENDPEPLPYLSSTEDAESGGFNLVLEVYLSSPQMREKNINPVRLSRSQFKEMYWTLAQMITHHSSNGCNLRPGDLIASGTVSGSTVDSRGCLLELSWRGTEVVTLPTGEERRFLEDGDEVTMRGFGEKEGFRRVGFGECRGKVAESAG